MHPSFYYYTRRFALYSLHEDIFPTSINFFPVVFSGFFFLTLLRRTFTSRSPVFQDNMPMKEKRVLHRTHETRSHYSYRVSTAVQVYLRHNFHLTSQLRSLFARRFQHRLGPLGTISTHITVDLWRHKLQVIIMLRAPVCTGTLDSGLGTTTTTTTQLGWDSSERKCRVLCKLALLCSPFIIFSGTGKSIRY